MTRSGGPNMQTEKTRTDRRAEARRDEPVVDVGIPTTGSAPALLAEAVQSVFDQTLPNWRLTIGENGPGLDSVREALEPYLADPRVTHHVTGTVVERGRNWTNLIRTGTAPYHGLLHDDDRWGPGFLERRVSFLEDHPSCGYVYGGTIVIDEAGRPRGRTILPLPPGVQRSATIVPALYKRNWIGVPTFLARRSAYEAVGGEYKELIFTDNEMFLRLAAFFDVGCIAVWDGYYRIHSVQTSADRRTWGENTLDLLDAVEDLPIAPSLRRMVRAETHLRCALDAAQVVQRRHALGHVYQALRTDPASTLFRPSLSVRLVATLAAIVGGAPVRRRLIETRERRWQTGGAAGLLDLSEDRRLPRSVPAAPDGFDPTWLSASVTCPTCGSSAVFARSLSRWSIYRCSDRACDLRFAHPQPTDEALAAAYAVDYATDSRGDTPEEYARALVDALTESVGSLAGRRVLDFGAGVGTIAGALLSQGALVDAVESNPEARQVIESALDIPVYAELDELPAKRYDVIVMVEVIEHLRNPRATLEELVGLLRDDGALFVTTPNVASLRARLEGRRWAGIASHTHLVYFTGRSLRNTLRLAGFLDVSELRDASRHPEHSSLRGAIQRSLHRLELDGGIQVVARKHPVALEPAGRAR
jgi:2-polyprenyl-3-methyl-5-hydroxy-6-metoxy-1,4-benzoquinol methylase